eukprot:scaffold2202_cov136-Isochrysis_galbana.AAC.3
MGSITIKTVKKPAGVFTPYGRAVTSSRFSLVASLAAIIAYQTLPKSSAQPTPGHTIWKTISANAWKSAACARIAGTTEMVVHRAVPGQDEPAGYRCGGLHGA